MIQKVLAKNFLSWEELEFNIQDGVTLIDGWNEDDQTSEGSGKSAILNAISWCLFGQIPKDANIDDVIKSGQKSCLTSVVFSDGTGVVRTRGPNNLFVIRNFNFDEKIKGKDARETQQIIEDMVGLTFETFCQTVYFAQNYNKKFVTANQEEKAKILSEVQNLNVFDKARKEVQNLLKIEETAQTQLEHKIDLLKKDLQLIEHDIRAENNLILERKNQKQRLVDDITRQINVANEQMTTYAQQVQILQQRQQDSVVDPQTISALQLEITQLKIKYSEIEKQASGIDTLLKSRSQKESLGKRYAARYKTLEQDKQRSLEFIQNPTKECPTCGSKLENCDVSHAQNEVKNADSEMSQLMGMLQEISGELEQPAPVKTELQIELSNLGNEVRDRVLRVEDLTKIQKTNTECAAKLSQLKMVVTSARDNLYTLQIKKSEIEATKIEIDESRLFTLKQNQSELISNIENISKVVQDKRNHVVRLNSLKDGFKEVKSHVFNSLLNEINNKVNQYLMELFHVPASIKFINEDMKIVTEISLNGASRSLGLLSGGQFRRFSLAIDLALSDIISSRKNSKFGIIILDEYCKDLSESSMEKCLRLLQKRSQPVIMIEHNSIFKSIVDNSFQVKLSKGTSYAEV